MSRGDGQDLYAELGVPKTADAAAIKKAYRNLAQQCHPDRTEGDPEAEERFKRISSAYGVLSDEERRAHYDEFGDLALDPNFDPENVRRRGGGFPGGDFSQAFGHTEDLGNIFEDLFGGGGRTPRARRGPDLETSLQLDFEEAALGAEKRVELDRPQPGGGTRRETLKVRIPPGADDQARVRLAGKGGPGSHGGPPGDLYARLRVRPHRFLDRSGRDLSMGLPISVTEAIGGADIEIPTLYGPVTLHVPPASDGGTRLRLRGKGVAAGGGKKAGDLYVTLRIRVPKELGEDQLRQLDELLADDPESWRSEAFS